MEHCIANQRSAYFPVLCQKNKVAIIVSISAAGTASHTPVTPIRSGSVSNNTVINPNVRRNDRTADDVPSDNAVNAAEVKMFIRKTES